MNQSTPKKALFLDRDGVINVDHNYVHKIEDCQFIDGIFQLAKDAVEKNYDIFIITNQAGIGRGLYSEADFETFTGWMEKQFERNEAPVRKTYYCPYHPEHGVGKYKKDSFDRKPNPGMILKIAEVYGIDVKNSVLVGDKESDIEAGSRAGIGKLILFDSENKSGKSAAHHIIFNLNQALELL